MFTKQAQMPEWTKGVAQNFSPIKNLSNVEVKVKQQRMKAIAMIKKLKKSVEGCTACADGSFVSQGQRHRNKICDKQKNKIVTKIVSFLDTNNAMKRIRSPTVRSVMTTESGVEVVCDNSIQVTVLRSKINKAVKSSGPDFQ